MLAFMVFYAGDWLSMLNGIAIAASVDNSMQFQAAGGQIDRIFGKNADTIKEFASTSTQAFGISEKAATTFASVYGNLLGGFISGSDELASKTTELLGQSAVIAAATGRTIDDVNERIRSGLLGNTESIEDLGINVNIAMLESTEAFRKFAEDKSWNQLDFQTQQQIRLAAILEQSYVKYGDTVQDSAVKSNNEFKACLEDIATLFGERLLPVLTDGMEWFTELLNENQDSIQKWAEIIAFVASVILAALQIIAGLPPEVLIVIGVVMLAVTAFFKINKAVKESTGVIGEVSKAFQAANPTFGQTAVMVLAIVAAVALLVFLLIALTQGADKAKTSLEGLNNMNINPPKIGTNPGYRGYASGTRSALPGMAWVGENGPELMRFKGGEQVYNATQSMAMASLGDKSQPNITNIYEFKVDNIATYMQIEQRMQNARISQRKGYVG